MIEANEAHLVELEEEKQRLVKAYAAGALTLDDIAGEKTRIEKRIGNLTQAIEELRADMDHQVPTAQDLETIEEYAGLLHEGADLAINEPEEQQTIYRLLQMEARLTHDDGQHWADVRCILGETHLSTEYITT
jgi:predicted  nucleic acid-binding Zn-ribbon protein